MGSASGPITQLLARAGDGDCAARDELWQTVYHELRAMARQQLARERGGQTLQPTALVHEAYFRLFAGDNGHFANSRHFFAAAGRAMRQILVDEARRRHRLKRGAGYRRVPLSEHLAEGGVGHGQANGHGACWAAWATGPAGGLAAGPTAIDPATLLALDEALTALERSAPRMAEIITIRFFAGLTEDEAAAAMGISKRLLQMEWRLARAWLYREMSGGA